MTKSYDPIVIGAGILGSSIAHFLSNGLTFQQAFSGNRM